MNNFVLDKDMLTMSGVFYPTGYMFIMFAGKEQTQQAAQAIAQGGVDSGEIYYLSPEMIQEQVVRTVGGSDDPLPSAGTEADTVRKYAELASQGHHALLVHAPSSDDSDKVMAALHGHPIAYGQKYRMLVIEDLEQ